MSHQHSYKRQADKMGENEPLIVPGVPVDASEAGAGGSGAPVEVVMARSTMDSDEALEGGKPNAAVSTKEAAGKAAAAMKQEAEQLRARLSQGGDEKKPAGDVEAGPSSAAKKVEEGASLFTILVVVLCFVGADAGKPLFEKMGLQSEGTLQTAAVLNVIAFLNILISAGLSCYYLGPRDAARQLFDRNTFFLYAIPSAFFSASQLFTVAQNKYVSPSLRKVFQQLRIPITAVMGRWIMGNAYSNMQWLIIGAVLLAVPAFQMSQTMTGELEFSNTDNQIGLCFSIITSMLACFGSIYCEKYTKAGGKTPFYVQKFQIEVWTFLAGLVGLATLQPLSGGLADMVNAVAKPDTAVPWQNWNGQAPWNYRTLQATVAPMHTQMAWTAAPAGAPSKNKFDTAAWEKKHTDVNATASTKGAFQLPKEMQKDLTGSDLEDLQKVIQKYADLKRARNQAKFAGAANDFASRSDLAEVRSFVDDLYVRGGSVTEVAAKEQKYFFKHGFGIEKKVASLKDLTDNFVFTFGETSEDGFRSLAAFQRPSPRSVHSDVLSKKSYKGEDFYHGSQEYFTGKKFEVDEKAVERQVTTKMSRTIVAKGPTVFVTYQATKSFERPTANGAEACETKVGQTYALQCQVPLQFSAEEDFVSKHADCIPSAAVFHGDEAQQCKPKVKAAKLTIKEAAEKKAEKKAAKAAQTEEEKVADFEKEVLAKLAPTVQAQLKYSPATPASPPAATLPQQWAQIVGDEAFALKNIAQFPAKIDAWAYPGKTGAGLANACDKALCGLTSEEWTENFSYMTNNFHNNPSLKLKYDEPALKNPFAHSEIHGYTRNPLPWENFNFLLVLAIAANIAQSWLSGLLAKVLSSLWKNLCQTAATAMVVVIQKVFMNDWSKQQLSPTVAGGAKWPETTAMTMLVLLCVFSFGQAPKLSKGH